METHLSEGLFNLSMSKQQDHQIAYRSSAGYQRQNFETEYDVLAINNDTNCEILPEAFTAIHSKGQIDHLREPVEGNNLSNSVVNGLCYIDNDYSRTEKDIAQKNIELKVLQENSVLLKSEIKEKHKALESSKMELLTEQDSHDNIQKILSDEVENIMLLGSQQEALNNQMKHVLDQKFKVHQLLAGFDVCFYEIKLESKNLYSHFENKIKEHNTILNQFSHMVTDICNKRVNVKEKQYVIKKLKSTDEAMKELLENIKMVYFQQSAILEYLKTQGDEESSKVKILECELKQIEENCNEKIDIEENNYVALNEKDKYFNNELLEVKQNIVFKKTQFAQLISEKAAVKEALLVLQQQENIQTMKLNETKSILSQMVSEAQMIKNILNTKTSVEEENNRLKEQQRKLKESKQALLENVIITDKSISKTKENCSNLEKRLTVYLKNNTLMKETTNELDNKRLTSLKAYEEINLKNKTEISVLEKQKYEYNSQIELLKHSVEEVKRRTEENSIIGKNKFIEILLIKQKLHENSETVVKLSLEIEALKNDITVKENQIKTHLLAVTENIDKKKIIKTNLEAEINERLTFLPKIEELKNKLQLINNQEIMEVKYLKDVYKSEIQSRKIEIDKVKNDFETRMKVKKENIADLQIEIVDEQKKELSLIRAFLDLKATRYENKRNLLKLQNVIKALDGKLMKIAETVMNSNSIKNKQSLYTQSTVLLNTQSKCVSDNSNNSSSGISMRDNEIWKKELLIQQNTKQLNKTDNA